MTEGKRRFHFLPKPLQLMLESLLLISSLLALLANRFQILLQTALLVLELKRKKKSNNRNSTRIFNFQFSCIDCAIFFFFCQSEVLFFCFEYGEGHHRPSHSHISDKAISFGEGEGGRGRRRGKRKIIVRMRERSQKSPPMDYHSQLFRRNLGRKWLTFPSTFWPLNSKKWNFLPLFNNAAVPKWNILPLFGNQLPKSGRNFQPLLSKIWPFILNNNLHDNVMESKKIISLYSVQAKKRH